MSRTSTILAWTAVALLLGMFVFPLWSIHLTAPQYPEGLGMHIWMTRISGENPHDLKNINGLNHYIGMKPIHQESIPELRYMKFIATFLVGAGILAAALRKRLLLISWVILVVVAAVIGLADFYKWGYDYGHNLNPDAPIKVPGMTYQPPLIGSKKLLNITATSFPAAGGIMAMLSVGFGLAAWLFDRYRWTGRGRNTSHQVNHALRPLHSMAGVSFFSLLVALTGPMLLISSCSVEPSPIRYGTDQCSHCTMTISDQRYGAEIVTKKGKVYKYDSIECMLYNMAKRSIREDGVHSYLAVDYAKPGQFTDARTAVYLHSDELRSPMGMNLTAFSTRKEAEEAMAQYPGELLDWKEIQELVAGASKSHSKLELREGGASELVVAPGARFPTVASALAAAEDGARIVVKPGHYKEHGLTIDKRVALIGEGYPIIDGSNSGQIITVRADGTRIGGFVIQNVGTSYIEDRAGVKLVNVEECRIENNRFLNNFFAVYLENSQNCAVINNTILGSAGRETSSGNGIHLWQCRDIVVDGNKIAGHRDGIYFEFVENSLIVNNLSEGNLRYGLHFMFSNEDRYADNVFRKNGAGVAVMYSDDVAMVGNRFEHNWGSASFGLLLKDIRDSNIEDNVFFHNTVGIYSEGSIRLQVRRNEFISNGYSVKLMASSTDNTFTKNNFVNNTFDVATNSRQNFNTFAGNYWSHYDGYDLDGNGIGDVPYRPVRLFSLLAAEEPASMILLRSLFVDLIEAAEKVLPVFTPETLMDSTPLVHKVVFTGELANDTTHDKH